MTAWTVAATVLGLLYGLIEGFTGWSPGKLILGIRVVDESGQRAPVGKLLLRYLVKYSGSVLAFAGLVAGASVLSSAGQLVALGIVVGCFLVLGKARQALHDKIAGTAVLRKSDIGAPAPAAGIPPALA